MLPSDLDENKGPGPDPFDPDRLKVTPEDMENMRGGTVIASVKSMLKRCSSLLEERGHKYGRPEDNLIRTAAMASAVLGFEIKPSALCLILTVMKICRSEHSPHERDHGDDGVNYLALALEFRRRGL